MEPEKNAGLNINSAPDSKHAPKKENPEKNNLTEKQKEKRKNVITVLAGIAIIATLAVSGIKYSEHVKASPVVTTTAAEITQLSQTTTTESITTTTENALAQKVESYSEAMEKYRGMSVKEFEALPRDERLLYSQYIIDRTISHDNYDEAYGEGEIGQDFAIEYTPVSTNNNGQEIMDNILYANQISFLQFRVTEESKKIYNLSDGIKCLSSVYSEVGDEKIVTNDYLDNKALKETFKGVTALSNINIVTDTSAMLDGIGGNGNKIKYKSIMLNTESDTTFNTKCEYVEFTGYDGTLQNIWLLENQIETTK